ncbi:MAG: AAA family ATPase [Candidatus Ozemobacteraceae bacterium]
MRIERLFITNYRNLRSFEINFDESQPTTVFLGRNGTGKSNLIEAIVEIFRELEKGKIPAFSYTLDYVCQGKKIHIDANPSRTRKPLIIQVNGEPLARNTFLDDPSSYLPANVFAYYSGWSNRLENQFNASTRQYYRSILNSSKQDLPLRRFFFCRKEYSQSVLLAFFLSKSGTARELLGKYLGIVRFESALFVLKKPWWRGSGAPSKIQKEEGDPRFWYARGSFKGFLDRLWNHALAPICNDEVIERDVRRQGEVTERLYLFIKNEKELMALKESGEDSKTLFGFLESLFLCDLIDEVRVTVEKKDGSRIKFDQLSEGEQQLLTVLGLLIFTQNDESLYLLDEPDTHLNPVWTYNFLKLLQENIRTEKGQLLISTHNPLMIGSLHKKQVRVFNQSDKGIFASEPEYDPIGIGVEGLLKSELYGLRSSLAPEILQKLDRHYTLLGKPRKTPQEKSELMELADELNQLGVSRTHPNPYFEAFANAMAKHHPTMSQAGLSEKVIKAQTKMAEEVVKELLEEEQVAKKVRGGKG